MKNQNCDNDKCQSATGQVRVLPTGDDSNAILCRACFGYELRFRAERNKALADANRFDLPTWDSLKVYGEPEPPTCPTCNVSARSIRLAGNARRCQNCGSEWNQ